MPLRQAIITAELTPELSAAFSRTVSLERWKTYQRAAGFDDRLAYRLYLWNAAAGQSFHFPLQTLEVALRNVVHQAIASIFGPDWPKEQTCRNMLHPKQVDDITKAERRHFSIKQNVATTPQIVASLSLGFWTAMLRRNYKRAIWSSQLEGAFPNLPADATIGDVSRKANSVQDLRNRIFHQEPLIGHDLSGEYGDILALLGWICEATRDWTRAQSSVPQILRTRPR
jgi:hypothetical protein